jgi:hypothetical protein
MPRVRSALVAFALLACASKEPPPEQLDSPSKKAEAADSSAVRAENIGKKIDVVGWAQNRKNGAVLVGDDFDLWIDDLHSWPDGFYTGGDRGRKLVVSGTLAQDHALPVFVEQPGEPVKQGIPVPEGTDLDAASHRWVLRDATWRDAP